MNWHRLFGLLLTDFFTGSPFVVELEKDLSVKLQLLDVVILRTGSGKFAGRLPDGLDDLAAYNLITFKSHQQTLDDWALKELTGHYVNLRKQVSPARGPLLPEDAFRLYAISSRFRHKLSGMTGWQAAQEGVYDCRRGTDAIRVIVLCELPARRHNAVLHLLSAKPELVEFGATNYQRRSPDTSTLLDQLFEDFQREGIDVPYTMEDFRREYIKTHYTPEQRLEGLSPDDRLKGLSPDDILKAISPDEIEDYLKRIKQGSASRKRKKKK